ncbi:polysaccharide pyruvyl transferase family protein [Pseudomonas mucidolens]|uniref:Polysaccharide pyruvyl transferase family protein WcaK n=1 Tax=Pseudomonas mucidolens TaxID=46679 RepID=A0A1H2M3P1_9PSED|nr:polysaccharide pyruvyl transferase family protein [Pseudomonas mucidolens]SDU87625.1 Polysaccharide pyruvyl transferase family protein WcaK [Pseudomonas mucidolens]SQH34650.1 colanic acid biosynthesis protein [Pseudomonas mucidolens]
MNVTILHGYSASNSGDGLLVDLAIALVLRNFGADTSINVVASDPQSFSYLPYKRYDAPVMAAKGLGRVRQALFLDQSYTGLANLLRSSDLIVGVGGGYMRSKSAFEHIKLKLGHAKQLETAILSKVPSVYLPQSIGPFHGESSKIVGHYANADAVFVRDNRSSEIFATHENVYRVPDLAVQALASKILLQPKFTRCASSPAVVCVVLRKPPAWSKEKKVAYVANLKRLLQRLKNKSKVVCAVQSAVRGNDDGAFYRELGITEELLSLKATLAKYQPDVVISVRLHGAIESLLAGVPAYHISYERKGFGAYQDMGVEDWVINGGEINVDSIIDTVYAPNALSRFGKQLTDTCKEIEAKTLVMDSIIKGIVR